MKRRTLSQRPIQHGMEAQRDYHGRLKIRDLQLMQVRICGHFIECQIAGYGRSLQFFQKLCTVLTEGHCSGPPPTLSAGEPHQSKTKRGSFFTYSWSFFCLQLSFFAYSPLRPLLDALSHCKQKAPTVGKTTFPL